MTTIPTHYLYRVATGETVEPGESTCCLCGCECTETVPVSTVIRDTFTDHGMLRVPRSQEVCLACNHYFNHRWDAGQKYQAEYRKRSILVTPKGVRDWQREQMKADVESWLHNGCPEGIFVISLSKKKHLLPMSTINSPSTSFVVKFELDNVEISQSYWKVAAAFSCLMSLGAKKGEILDGNYHHSTLKKLPSKESPSGAPASIAMLMSLDSHIRPWRPSPLLSLVSYIITEDQLILDERAMNGCVN